MLLTAYGIAPPSLPAAGSSPFPMNQTSSDRPTRQPQTPSETAPHSLREWPCGRTMMVRRALVSGTPEPSRRNLSEATTGPQEALIFSQGRHCKPMEPQPRFAVLAARDRAT